MSVQPKSSVLPDYPEHIKPSFADQANANGIDFENVYGDALVQIPMTDLVGNPVAIQMLLNERLLLAAEVKGLRAELALVKENAAVSLADVKAQAEHLKASPFIAMLGGVLGVLGTATIGFGYKWLTAQPDNTLGLAVVLTGLGVSLTGNLANYLFPKWVGRGAKQNR